MRYPPELIVRALRTDEWPLIAERFEAEYGVLMPLPENPQHVFYGAFLGEKLVGFAHLEKVVHLGEVFVDQKHRNKHLAHALFETIDEAIVNRGPMVIGADKRLARLMRRFGFREWPMPNVWRRDG